MHFFEESVWLPFRRGRKDARVRFLMPITVKGGHSEEAPARIAPVE